MSDKENCAVVVVGIRFSVLSALPNWKVVRTEFEEYRNTLFDKERLEYRFRLFEALTIPSLQALDVPPNMRLHVVVITSEQLPEWAKARLREDLAGLSSTVVEVGVEGPKIQQVMDEQAREFVAAQGWQENPTLCVTVRLDDDDALDSNYLKALAPYARWRFAGFALSFARGYAAEIDARSTVKLVSLHHLYQPKIALGMAYVNVLEGDQWRVRKQRTVYDLGAHNAVDAVVPLILVSDAPRYIRTIHGHNDDRMDGWHYALARVAPSALKDAFDAVLDRCEVKVPEGKPGDYPTFNTARELFRNAEPHRALNRIQQKKIKKLRRSLREQGAVQGWFQRMLSGWRRQSG